MVAYLCAVHYAKVICATMVDGSTDRKLLTKEKSEDHTYTIDKAVCPCAQFAKLLR